MSKDTEILTKYQQRRESLRKLSDLARQMREEFTANAKNQAELLKYSTMTINDIILKYLYNTGTATEFKTFNQWKKAGFKVKKGSKAFVLWGQKKSKSVEIEAATGNKNNSADVEEYSFFPLVYLFSNLQVEREEGGNNASN